MINNQVITPLALISLDHDGTPADTHAVGPQNAAVNGCSLHPDVRIS